jgi:hypothetical protein
LRDIIDTVKPDYFFLKKKSKKKHYLAETERLERNRSIPAGIWAEFT